MCGIWQFGVSGDEDDPTEKDGGNKTDGGPNEDIGQGIWGGFEQSVQVMGYEHQRHQKRVRSLDEKKTENAFNSTEQTRSGCNGRHVLGVRFRKVLVEHGFQHRNTED